MIDLDADYLALEQWLLAQARIVAGTGWRALGVPAIAVLAQEPAVPCIAIEYEADAPEPDARAGRRQQNLVQTWRVWVCVPFIRDAAGPQAGARSASGPMMAKLARRIMARPLDTDGTPGPALTRVAGGGAVGLDNGLACYPLQFEFRAGLTASAGAA